MPPQVFQNAQANVSRLHFSLRLLLVFCAFFLAGGISLNFPFMTPNLTLIWLPSGIALVALLRWGFVMCIPIFLAALSLNLITDVALYGASVMALGNTLAPAAIAWYLNKKHFSVHFPRREDVLRFFVGSALGMSISASLGCFILWHSGNFEQPQICLDQLVGR